MKKKKDLNPPTCIFKKFTDKFFGECHLLPPVSGSEIISVALKNDSNYFNSSHPIGNSTEVVSSRSSNLFGEVWY